MEGKMSAIPCSEVKLEGNKEKTGKVFFFFFWVFWGGGGVILQCPIHFLSFHF
jgi:hypothetical protein